MIPEAIYERRRRRRVIDHAQRIERELRLLEIVERCDCLLRRALVERLPRTNGARPQINVHGPLDSVSRWAENQRKKWQIRSAKS